ncbi:MAG: hypothetical protein KF752_12945 [Pirellulaceae bacterium]|nr:hypothetical protein [Pirellulaceae bacterium]
MDKYLRRLSLILALSCTLTRGVSLAQAPPAQRPLDSKTIKAAKDFMEGPATDSAGLEALKQCCVAYLREFTLPYQEKEALPNFRTTWSKLQELTNHPKQTPEARAVLVAQLVPLARRLADDSKQTAAARVNCVVLLGELDDARDMRTNIRMPSREALKGLGELLKNDTTPAYLHAVALHALERHTKDGWARWNDNAKSYVKTLALKFAGQLPANPTEAQMNAWLVRRGLDVLRIARAPDAIDLALGYVADAEQLPSIRLSALQYLCVQDATALTPEQQTLYVLGLTHFLRSQLVAWHQHENDLQRRTSGFAGGGNDQGLGGIGRSMSLGGGLDGAGFDNPASDRSGATRGGRLRPGRPNPGGTTTVQSRDWEATNSRRRLNELLQPARLALEGRRIEAEESKLTNHLTSDKLELDKQYDLKRLIELVDAIQSQINNTSRATSVQAIMNLARRDIEGIIRYSNNLSGFLAKYPELREGDEELEETEEEPAETLGEDQEPTSQDTPAAGT